MTYELLIQHQGTIMLPPVVENVSIEWERQGQPGKLIAEVAKTPGLSFQEGDPCRFSVDGTPVFYGFVFEKSRKGSTDDIIQITVYDQLYRCVQAHTSQTGWEPPNAASLWSITSDPAEEWPEWSQPLGAHDAYAAGAKVSHNGKHWTSDLDGNVWEPGVYGWTEASE